MKSFDLAHLFMTWQCRIRQISMREHAGRPSSGMVPKVLTSQGHEISPGVIVLLVRENSLESTEFLKFQVQKHNDPQDVYKKSLTYLQSTHYHRAAEFSDEMTALFSSSSELANGLVEAGRCQLEFSEFQQTYRLPCSVRRLSTMEPAYQASLWHNRVFNPRLGDDVQIIGFQPDWEEAVEKLAG